MAAAYLENNIRSSEVDWSKVIYAAKEDSQVFDRLAVKMKNFIRTAAYRASRRYVTESDEEWSLALLAFYEAVQSYREQKGRRCLGVHERTSPLEGDRGRPCEGPPGQENFPDRHDKRRRRLYGMQVRSDGRNRARQLHGGMALQGGS